MHTMGLDLERSSKATIRQAAVVELLDKRLNAELWKCSYLSKPGSPNFRYLNKSTVQEHSRVSTEEDLPSEYQMTRLRESRRALQALILHFRNLQVPLKLIKQSYDGVFSIRKFQFSHTYKPKRDLHRAEQELDKQRFFLLQRGHAEICEVEKRCFYLLRHVDKQAHTIKTMTEVLTTLEAALEDEKDHKVQSADKRSKLITEMNDHRRQLAQSVPVFGIVQQDVQAAADNTEDNAEPDLETVVDPIILRHALEAQREKLKHTQKRIVEFEAEYSDVIGRQEYEGVTEILREEDVRRKVEQSAYETAQDNLQGFRNKIDDLIADRDDFEDVFIELQYKATPKPSWSKIGDAALMEPEQWQEMYKSKSTKNMVNLVVELMSGDASEIIKVPVTDSGGPFLDTLCPNCPRSHPDGFVYIRNLSLRQVTTFLNEIISERQILIESAAKAAQESTSSSMYGGVPGFDMQPFPAYALDYVEKSIPWSNLRAEWVHSLQKAYDTSESPQALVTLFIALIQKKMDENVLWEFDKEIIRVRDHFQAVSKAGGHPEGSLPAFLFASALRELFPSRTDTDVQTLARAAIPTGVVADWYFVKFSNFFEKTDEGYVGEFMEELWRQYSNHRISHINVILKVLLSELGVSFESAERENDPSGETDVSIQQLIVAITAVSPHLSDEKLACAVRWVFFAETTLPSMPIKGIQLIRYVKEKLRSTLTNELDSDDEENGDVLLEQALEEFADRGTDLYDEKQEEIAAAPASKQTLAYLPLKHVVARLKGSSLVWLK